MLDGITGSSPFHDWSTEFKEGDIISFLGATGRVKRINHYPYLSFNQFPIEVMLDSGRELIFMADGRLIPEATTGLLCLVRRAAPMVKKYQYLMKLQNGKYEATELHYTDEQAGNEPTWIKIEESMIQEEA
jgi:hypothetical protein